MPEVVTVQSLQGLAPAFKDRQIDRLNKELVAAANEGQSSMYVNWFAGLSEKLSQELTEELVAKGFTIRIVNDRGCYRITWPEA